MNRGVYQSSLMQQMVGRSPSPWSMNNLMPPSQEMSTPLASSSTSSSLSSPIEFPKYSKAASFNPMIPCHENQELPESWSQLLLGGLVGEEEGCSFPSYPAKSMENWEYQMLCTSANAPTVDVKQEDSEIGQAYYYGKDQEAQAARSSWSPVVPASSPRSCVTTSFSSNILDFSNSKAQRKHHQSDYSSECNSNSGAAFKKARVQAASAQSPLKVRKEKLGDRIAALHQLVSPFGKTDTASVLLEAIGYIRFLHGQIEALSSPYLGSGSCRNTRQSGKGDRNIILVEEPGQLLNDSSMKRRGPPDQDDDDDEPKDLRSRGLCLVPVSFTLHVGSDNAADFWAPNFGMGF